MEPIKQCKTCQVTKPMTDFKVTYKIKSPKHPNPPYYTRECKDCLSTRAKTHRKENKELYRHYRVRDFGRELGLSKPEIKALQAKFKAHNGNCDICGIMPERSLHIDHCHETKAIRGFLCHNCNVLLGHARDSEKILSSAIDYLRDSAHRGSRSG